MRAVGRPLALGRPNVARSRRVKLSRLRRWQGALAPLSRPGLVVAMLFMAVSLTPSLVPRSYVYQGIVSGLSLGIGYAIGVAGRWLWSFLELPMPGPDRERLLTRVAVGATSIVLVILLWQASAWQNEVRAIMHLPPVGESRPITIALIASATFGVLLLIARVFVRNKRFVSRRLEQFLPRRVSRVLAAVIVVFLFWGTFSRVFFEWALETADSVSKQVDATIPPDTDPPTDPLRAGSAASLIDWRDLGLAGRRVVSSGPQPADLAGFLGGLPLVPIRTYVGLNAADTAEARAELALRELLRVGAFDRSYLVLITPTGTGWVDPAALDSLEYLLRGDVASVTLQYSYLPSVLALPTEGAYGVESAQALFRAVYGHWTELPRDQRPALYLFGLSLGALNSDLSFDLHDVIADPFNGALWAGPPFRAEHWRTITSNRDPGSPVWRPRFHGGKVVRFMTQQGGLERGDGTWGPLRIAYLQYASDPMTFFTIDTIYKEPQWMREPRGADVAKSLRWFPVVTTVQLLADMAVSNTTPPGFGHTFAASHYIDAWLALIEPPGWPAEEVARLKALLAEAD